MERNPQPEVPPMTDLQRRALTDLCIRYLVLFREEDYQPAFDLPEGWRAGWVGGIEIQAETPTIYCGVSPEGEVHT